MLFFVNWNYSRKLTRNIIELQFPIQFPIYNNTYEFYCTDLLHFDIINIQIQINFLFLFLILNNNTFVLIILSDNLFTFNQSYSLLILNLILFFNSKIDVIEKIKVVSSANKTDLKVSDIFGRSLIYKINNNGPSTDPCGTQHFI